MSSRKGCSCVWWCRTIVQSNPDAASVPSSASVAVAAYDYDLFVIGGGSGGVRAARIAAGYGARVGLQYSFNDLLHIGLDVGWLDVEHDLSGDGVDLTLTNSGLVVGLGISYRLSNSPRPLE